MTLVNCTVISSSNKIVYPWKITHVGDDKVSITELYVNNINAEQKGTLSKAYLPKDCLDLIDVSVELNAAVNSFGPHNTITCLDFRKSLSPNQPPARMHFMINLVWPYTAYCYKMSGQSKNLPRPHISLETWQYLVTL